MSVAFIFMSSHSAFYAHFVQFYKNGNKNKLLDDNRISYDAYNTTKHESNLK
jgi:hypothetical protein